MTHWYVGQKVQCITESWDDDRDKNYPIKGEVYTIEHIEIRKHKPYAGETEGVCFLLLEITNPPRWLGCGFMEIAFGHRGFRPLVDTNIEVFQKMLAKKLRKKSAPSPLKHEESVR